MPDFVCRVCGAPFTVPPSALEKFPGWTPSKCRRCREVARGRAPRPAARLTPAEVLQRYTAGPKTGLFTDGSASPNPGPGGFAAVYVVDDEIIDAVHGREPHTTNNRMELVALIEAYRMAATSVPLDVFSDSELCVRTINEWAASWARRGWRRAGGPIKNLELVQELYALALEKRNLTLRHIKAHDGSRWNEYADALAGS